MALRTMFRPSLAGANSGVCARAPFSSSTRVLADAPAPAPFRISRTADASSSRPTFTDRPQRRSGNDTVNGRILSLLGDRSAQRSRNSYQGSNTSRFSNRGGNSAHSNSAKSAEELAKHKQALELTKQIGRRWKTGDVYAPHDLSDVEMQKWKKRGKPGQDVCDVLEIDPKTEYRNFSMLAEYVTPMGRIMSSTQTGLRNVNQRKMARAVRRMVGMGFMPSVHRHPEILMKESLRRNEQLSRVTKVV